jgi:hypothetical protein
MWTKTIAIALVVAACGNKPAPDTKAPTEKPQAAGPCEDAVARSMDRMFAIHEAYFASTDRIQWSGDCEAVAAQLKGAAPSAIQYVEDMRAFTQQTREDAQCGRAITDASNSETRGKSIVERLQKVLDTSKPADERCRDKVKGWRSQFDTVVGALGAA